MTQVSVCCAARMVWIHYVVLLTVLCELKVAKSAPSGDEFKLIVLHNNDMHARFEQTNALSGKCSHKLMTQNKCYGGFPRVAHIVNTIKNQEKNVIFLNAGDTYQGTVWYTIYKWPVVAKFIQMIGLDAMSLGNHEFDDGVDGLAPFVSNITIPVVGANMNLSLEPNLQGKIKPSAVLEVDNRKIGVIGYLTPETQFIAKPGKIKFEDEVVSIDREAKRLKAQGINILIAVGHSGFGTDQRIAREVEDIDLVIGGHTNTFLYSGNKPDSEVAVGLYPTLINQPSGRQVPVVSAYAYTKYMGRIDLTFDASGEIIHHQGIPILLDRTVPQDEAVLAAMKPWGDRIAELSHTELGRTRVFLNGSQNACRMRECNMGNLITDAFVQYNAWQHSNLLHEGWTDAPISVANGGGIRNSIDEKANNGTITLEDVLGVLPFQNSLVNAQLRGLYLKDMLENSVVEYDKTGIEAPGKFLQVSGLKVTYDLNKPPGSRVVEALARCGNCRSPVYTSIQDNDLYGVITTTYIAEGGDGFTQIRDHAESKVVLDATESDVMAEYIKRRSPISTGVENRILLQSNQGSHASVLTPFYGSLLITTVISTLLFG